MGRNFFLSIINAYNKLQTLNYIITLKTYTIRGSSNVREARDHFFPGLILGQFLEAPSKTTDGIAY